MNTASAFSQTLAGVVAESVKARGMTQRQVSEAAGIPLVSLNRKLGGHRPFNVAELSAVADVIGVSTVDLMLRAERAIAA